MRMTREEALKLWLPIVVMSVSDGRMPEVKEAVEMAIKALENQPTDAVDRVTIKEYLDSFGNEQMTAEEYRQRMVQAFYNADCCELIAVCVRPTEKEFEHLEWLLKNHYKKEPCEDAISRKAVNELVDELARAISDERCCISRGRSTATIMRDILHLPSVTPQPKMGRWEKRDVRGQRVDCCSVCGLSNGTIYEYNYCPNCGAKMQEVWNDN